MDINRAIEAFVQTVESGNFARAAVQLGVTAAAVSKQIAALEAHLGVRLFQRTTRSLQLTESGERLLREVREPWTRMRDALARLRQTEDEPEGTLRVSVGTAFGLQHVLPLLPAFLERYPRLKLDWSFENRRVNLVQEGFDAAIGAGLDPDSRVVARALCPVDAVICGAPGYLAGRERPQTPADLQQHDCILLRSATTGRARDWILERADERVVVPPRGRLYFTELDAIREAVRQGMGLGLLGLHHMLDELEAGEIEPLLPGWQAPRLWISVYFASREWLEPKVRVFVDYLVAAFADSNLQQRMAQWRWSEGSP
ncbi:LysR family transcriptional regulator [Mangrovitalea sediminis]|uniref:LysR family transcriptional regulator n=1 Tax=Mangrovitalea sediminis TaxID=1982043 RepID=UPI0018E94E26|nr:LysR family transcriptional regulator [Mangrovitalea sediminis]